MELNGSNVTGATVRRGEKSARVVVVGDQGVTCRRGGALTVKIDSCFDRLSPSLHFLRLQHTMAFLRYRPLPNVPASRREHE